MTKFSRRRFLHRLGQTGFATWLGAEMALDAMATPVASSDSPAPASGTDRGILKLRLQAADLDALARFYTERIGWPISRVGSSLKVRAGGTDLRFDPAPQGTAPYYHIAWAIPSNKFEIGKLWLSERLPLLRGANGQDEFHFKSANRRAVYFADPADNILELIARDELGDTAPGPFSLADVLYVNHVGLVVNDMETAISAIRGPLGLEPKGTPQRTFATLGDSYRHLTLVPTQRPWLPERERGAKIFKSEVVLHGPQDKTLELSDLACRLSIAS